MFSDFEQSLPSRRPKCTSDRNSYLSSKMRKQQPLDSAVQILSIQIMKALRTKHSVVFILPDNQSTANHHIND